MEKLESSCKCVNVFCLCDTGADVNSCTACEDSALHLASFCSATQNVKSGLGIITSLFEAGNVYKTYHILFTLFGNIIEGFKILQTTGWLLFLLEFVYLSLKLHYH